MNVDQGALEQAARDAATDTTAEPIQTQTSETKAPGLTELDSLSEFSFQGEKLTPEELHKALSGYKSLSERAKTFEEEDKYTKNLEVDIDNVLADPRLAEKFKQVYPKKYHAILDKLLQTNRQPETQSQVAQTQTQPQVPKELLGKLSHVEERLGYFEKRAFEAEVEAANAKIEAILPPLLEKYELASEEQVYARAEMALNAGQKLNEKTWERFVRESHEAYQKKSDRYYGAKLKEQIEKGQKGADIGAGGASPGQAPVKPKTFDEAREAMIASLQSQKTG